jgi:hypothetical protein
MLGVSSVTIVPVSKCAIAINASPIAGNEGKLGEIRYVENLPGLCFSVSLLNIYPVSHNEDNENVECFRKIEEIGRNKRKQRASGRSFLLIVSPPLGGACHAWKAPKPSSILVSP